MDAGELSPAELPFGARVRAVFTKYDGTPHWEYDLVVLGVDQYGVWVGGAPGGLIARPGREITSDVHWLTLYPHEGMWVATVNDAGGVFTTQVYVDVTSRPSWWHRPDGVLHVSAVDLDLDVVLKFSGELYVDDVDEFDEHRVAFGYPADVVEGAQHAARVVHDLLDRRGEPFDTVMQGWMQLCRDHVSTSDRGHAQAAGDPGAVAGAGDDGEVSGTGASSPAALGSAEPEGEPEEDLLAVWRSDPPAAPPDSPPEPRDLAELARRAPVAEAEDRPAVEVEYDDAPLHLDADHVAHYVEDERGVARDFDEAQDIDTSPVDPAEITGLLLTTESGTTSPLWFDGRPVEPEEVGVGEELADHLRDWADRWNRDFDPERGWHPRASIDDYEALGRWLGRRLKDEVGGVAVTLQLAHLGRSSVAEIAPADQRERIGVDLDADAPGDLPVRGEIVTLGGVVGCFSSTLNTRLSAWADDGGADTVEAAELQRLMGDELGGDYRVGGPGAQ